MKRFLFLVLFVALIGGSTMNLWIYIPPMGRLDRHGIPVNYYSRRCIIPLGMPVETWLTVMKWPRDYKEGVWDCSQTSSFTEWALENCGYQTEIVTTLVPFKGRLWGHAYVDVKIKGVWYSYETTGRRLLTREDLITFIGPDMTFRSIYSLQSFYRYKKVFVREWVWWRQGEAR